MTKNDYASWLLSLIGQDRDDTLELRDQFYGYFQHFMPDGQGLEQVFRPLPDGEQLYQRLKLVFTATQEETLQSLKAGYQPGYFVPRCQGSVKELQDLGREWLQQLILFATFLSHQTLVSKLEKITAVRMLEAGETKRLSLVSYMLSLLRSFQTGPPAMQMKPLCYRYLMKPTTPLVVIIF